MANNQLGEKIHQLLQAHNLENSLLLDHVLQWGNPSYSTLLVKKLADFLHHLGVDIYDATMVDTPQRVVDLLLNNVFYGLNYNNFPKIILQENNYGYITPLVTYDIRVNSTCEHHLVSIRGRCTISYIPQGVTMDSGKLIEIVDFFARRPQVQERMTKQILLVLQDILTTADVAVAIKAVHDCVSKVGADGHDVMITSVEAGGKFDSDAILRANFYQLASTMRWNS